MTTTGGHRLRAHIREMRQKASVEHVDAGFFKSARYPTVRTGKNGGQKQTPHFVATVAAWNEFGNRAGVPERPFMRRAIKRAEDGAKAIIRRHAAGKGKPTRAMAEELGAYMASMIQREITDLKDPPNAPSTIERKGSSNPLMDTEWMRKNVGWNVG